MSILKKIMGSVVLLVVLFFAGSVPVTAASQAMQEHEPLYFCFGDSFYYRRCGQKVGPDMITKCQEV